MKIIDIVEQTDSFTIGRESVNNILGTVDYVIFSREGKTHTYTVCSAWMLLGREKELDAEMSHRLKSRLMLSF